MTTCPGCEKQAGIGQDSCKLLMSAYVLAGLAMMLNIRLSYSAAPYALIRFKLPENLFSVFVRRMASALELWCLPSMLIGNIMELGLKGYYLNKGYKQVKYNATTWESHLGNLVPKGTDDSGSTPVNADKLIPAREWKNWVIIIPSIVSQWLNFLTYVLLLIVYLMGDEQGHLIIFYIVILEIN